MAVLVILENWSRWSMVEPEVQVTCGKSYGTGTVPDAVTPGFSEMALFEKGVRQNQLIFCLNYLPMTNTGFAQGTLRKGIAFKHKLSYSNYFGFC